MKNILALLVLVISINSVNANGDEPKSPVGVSVVKSGNVFKLFYKGEKTGTVKVSIYDEKGHVVWNETMKRTENFMRPYNFSSLPEGEYTIALADEQGKHYEKITHSFAKQESLARLTPVDRKEQKYLLTVPDQGPGTLTVKIFDQTNTLIYKSTEKLNGDYGKVYNLDKVNGVCIFEITDKSGTSNIVTQH